ncbi:zinc finger protein 133-like isoform X12 [Cloeon dipterum]|uniref:zinc finger protein 133-like isoform X12 n=1 Tax=Cloeon dipterum TaxID=197152 RepID=UPI0032206468
MAASTKVSDMCRLCGTDTLNVVRHHIFEGEGQVKKSAQKISECLPLHIAAEDPLPKNICGECSYKLDLMSDFREKAVKTDVMLVSLVEGVKPEIPDDDDDGPDHEIDNDFRSDTPVEQPEQQTEPEVLIKEEEAQQPQQPEKRPGRKAANKRPIQESDMEEEEEEAPAKKRGRKPKEKETAPAASATTSASTNPPKENTGWRKSPRAEQSNLESLTQHSVGRRRRKTSFECHFCNEGFKRKNALQVHMRAHLRVLFQCHLCQVGLPSRGHVRAHLRREHQVHDLYPCTMCSRKYRSKAALEIHLRNHTGERPFICPTCGKGYISFHTLKEHQTTHRERDKTFICEVCGKGFPKNANLKNHRKIHFEEARTEKCEICGWSTYCKYHLKSHMLTHTREKTVICHECGQSFIHQASLRHHMSLKHNPDRPPDKCGLCGKVCSSAFNLRRHMLTHSGMKDVACEICGNTFAQKSTLISHMWIMHKALPYKCAECDEQFRLQIELKQHRVAAHLNNEEHARPDKEPYRCEDCGRSFIHETSLKHHQAKAHNKYKNLQRQQHICDFCGRECLSAFNLRRHVEKHLRQEAKQKSLNKT